MFTDLNEAVVPTDQLIEPETSIKFWSAAAPDINGVLGGYPQVSKADLQASYNFIAKLRRKSIVPSGKLARAVDCGAGIGRVTKGLLAKVATVVDFVEPVKQLIDVVEGEEFRQLRESGVVGKVYQQGLQDWTADHGVLYNLIWIQWCTGYLSDSQLVDYLIRIQNYLAPHGWIVVKENLSTDPEGAAIFDKTDSSITRHDDQLRHIFQMAGLYLMESKLQTGFPRELYPVRMYALVPESKHDGDEDD